MSCSIILCTYNGASKLKATLQAITELQTKFKWELIVVDNNSTDTTGDFARSFLANSKIDYSVLDCKTPGKMNAFWRGLRVAKYEFILDCDDDNEIFPKYIENGVSYLEKKPNVGALGGIGLLKKGSWPAWFQKYSKSYALGPQGLSGKPLAAFNYLYGAGCFYRKSILDNLKERGFNSLLSCRKGNELSSGGDVELCHVIQLSGFELIYLESLRFYHNIAADRINFDYYLRLKSGIASSFPLLETYRFEEFDSDIKFRMHLLKLFWIVIKGLVKTTFIGQKSDQQQIDYVVVRSKYRAFLQNYKDALKGYKRNLGLFYK